MATTMDQIDAAEEFFRFFIKLPTEVQDVIWKLCVPENRVVAITDQKIKADDGGDDNATSYRGRISARYTVPAAMQVCKASRHTMSKSYTWILRDQLCFALPFNFDKDTLLMDGPEGIMTLWSFEKAGRRTTASRTELLMIHLRLQHLAVHGQRLPMRTINEAQQFLNLKTLVLPYNVYWSCPQGPEAFNSRVAERFALQATKWQQDPHVAAPPGYFRTAQEVNAMSRDQRVQYAMSRDIPAIPTFTSYLDPLENDSVDYTQINCNIVVEFLMEHELQAHLGNNTQVTFSYIDRKNHPAMKERRRMEAVRMLTILADDGGVNGNNTLHSSVDEQDLRGRLDREGSRAKVVDALEELKSLSPYTWEAILRDAGLDAERLLRDSDYTSGLLDLNLVAKDGNGHSGHHAPAGLDTSFDRRIMTVNSDPVDLASSDSTSVPPINTILPPPQGLLNHSVVADIPGQDGPPASMAFPSYSMPSGSQNFATLPIPQGIATNMDSRRNLHQRPDTSLDRALALLNNGEYDMNSVSLNNAVNLALGYTQNDLANTASFVPGQPENLTSLASSSMEPRRLQDDYNSMFGGSGSTFVSLHAPAVPLSQVDLSDFDFSASDPTLQSALLAEYLSSFDFTIPGLGSIANNDGRYAVADLLFSTTTNNIDELMDLDIASVAMHNAGLGLGDYGTDSAIPEEEL